jgi:hypothetical protein
MDFRWPRHQVTQNQLAFIKAFVVSAILGVPPASSVKDGKLFDPSLHRPLRLGGFSNNFCVN